MEAINRSQKFYDGLFSGINEVLSNYFIKNEPDYEFHAEILLEFIKAKEFDKKKYLEIIKNLNEREWNSTYVINTFKELNSVVGLSEEYLKKELVTDLKGVEFNQVIWDLSKKIVLNYAKHSKELYDSLKYSKASLSFEKEMLLGKLMKALSVINETSNELIDKYQFKNYNHNSMKKFINKKLMIDHLLLRINYILLNIDKEEKYSLYGDVLSSEIIEYTLIKK